MINATFVLEERDHETNEVEFATLFVGVLVNNDMFIGKKTSMSNICNNDAYLYCPVSSKDKFTGQSIFRENFSDYAMDYDDVKDILAFDDCHDSECEIAINKAIELFNAI